MTLLSNGDVVFDEPALEDTIQRDLNLRLYFKLNPFTHMTILEEYLKMAKEDNMLDNAKELKKKELVMNPLVSESPDYYLNNNLLDQSRVKALEMVRTAQ